MIIATPRETRNIPRCRWLQSGLQSQERHGRQVRIPRKQYYIQFSHTTQLEHEPFTSGEPSRRPHGRRQRSREEATLEGQLRKLNLLLLRQGVYKPRAASSGARPIPVTSSSAQGLTTPLEITAGHWSLSFRILSY